MYRVTFRCHNCKEEFTIDSKQLLDAIEEVSKNGCPNCKDIPDEDCSATLVKHIVIDNDGEEIKEEVIEYCWNHAKRDLELDFNIEGRNEINGNIRYN